MNILKKVAKKVENSKIVKNPKFLVIGLIIIVVLIALIYFIFLKYSPVMNFKYDGYAISGKEITENLLGSGDSDNDVTNANASKNIELTKIEEQGTIFKKLNDYFVGNKEKTEINLNYPIYINGNSAIYNLAEDTTLISKDFEEVTGYPNLSISEGKIYDGNNLERADAKEYIFVKTSDNIYINLYEIKVTTTANEYTIPVNSIVAFTEDAIRYYSINNNVLVFNEINDVDNNSNVQMVENNYTYEKLLTRLGILQKENNTENSNEQENIIEENTADNSNANNNEDEDTKNDEQANNTESSNQNNYIKPQVTADNFTAGVYTATSTLHIKDPSGRIIEAPTFEIYRDGKIYLRRTFSNSGTIEITGLVPDTEFRVIGKFTYLNENGQKVENTFYEGTFTTKGYEELGSIDIQKENGEIFSNKIQLVKVKITSDLNAEAIKGVNQVEIETGEIRTLLKNSQVNELLQGKEITIESSEGLKSDSEIKYAIKFYDRNGIELKVNNNEGETRTSKEAPTVRVNLKEQNIVSVTLGLKLTNRDNVELGNYKYVVTRPNGEVVQEKRLSENENELLLEDLDQNQYYKIGIYADYDLNNNKGKQENVEIGNLVFATQPISTLGSLELNVENKELTSTTSTITYQINEDRTDKRLIQILHELTINIVEQPTNSEDNTGNNNQETKEGTVVYTDTLTGDEITNLQHAGTKEIKYENLKSNTTYTIEITGNVQLGNTQENIPVTYNYKEFTTLKIPAKVEIRNQFVTGNLIDFDVRVEDVDNSVLNNKVRMELRNSNNDLIDLQELTTNEDYIRKTYEKLEENQIYKLRFIADQYNEGSTDETYKVNYLIKEIEIITEPGISGSIGLTELSRKATGKNLVDMSSETKWYVYPNFNTSDYYGKEYSEETKILKLGWNGCARRAVYDLREYAGQEVTMSFKAKAVNGTQNAYIQNSKTDTNRTKIEGISEEWKEFQYTLPVDDTGYLGFYIDGGNGIEIQELQIELGNKKTKYEEFQYILQSNYSINVEDRRDEITTNDYYIKIYEDNNLVKTDRYEEIPEENVITNAIKTYETQAGKQYKVELVIKIRDREYVLSELEYNTQDTEEIKGIYNEQDYLEIQPRGSYIILNDLDLRENGSSAKYRYGSYIPFEGYINFNGKKIEHFNNEPMFYRLGDNAKIENLVLNIYLPIKGQVMYGATGLFSTNYGTINNIQVNIVETTQETYTYMGGILGWTNYGTIDGFVINYKEPVYVKNSYASLIRESYGTIKNGYIIGEYMQFIEGLGSQFEYTPFLYTNFESGVIENVYTLVSVNSKKENLNKEANITVANRGLIRNIYSVDMTGKSTVTSGPNVWSNLSTMESSYYFSDKTLTNTQEIKSSNLALYDKDFQNQILNSEEKFNINDNIEQGYFPQLNFPDVMPNQEYVELPTKQDEDLADITSIETIEKENTKAKLKIIVNNKNAENIKSIQVKNLTSNIISQNYNSGQSEVIVEVYNPIVYTSEYEIISITTQGVLEKEYTREYDPGERKIYIDLYKEIDTVDEWKDINKSLGENYILTQDLDFLNQGDSIGINNIFSGKLNGGNHTIKNIQISKNRDGVISCLKGTIENLNVENYTQELNSNNAGFIAKQTNGAIVNNININNANLYKTSENTTTVGILVGVSNYATIKNSSVTNSKIYIESYAEKITFGGITGSGTSVYIQNSFVQNIQVKINNILSTDGIGGIIGKNNSGTIRNCYTTGKIETNREYEGGIAGYSTGEISNCYSIMNLISTAKYIGGIAGYVTFNPGDFMATNPIKYNMFLGNLYTTSTIDNRIVGNGELGASNLGYKEQKISGLADNEQNVELLENSEVFNKDTYLRKLLWTENQYDFTGLSLGILPKLKHTDTGELLENQNDVILEETNLKIINIETNKVNEKLAEVRLELENKESFNIQNINIEDMDVKINKNINENGITYLDLEVVPIKYLNNYRISSVTYTKENEEITEELQAKLELSFFKEIFKYEDWQELDEISGQNCRLMADLDFNGKNDIKYNVSIGNLEGNGHTIKNVSINMESSGGLIKELKESMNNVNFENINIVNDTSGNYVGIIGNNSGNLENILFKDIEIHAKNRSFVGCIANNTADKINNITLEGITLEGIQYVGGAIAYTTERNITNIIGDNINVNATGDYAGGIIGNVSWTDYTVSSYTNNITIKNSNIKGNSYVGGAYGYGRLYKVEGINNTIEGNTYVGGLSGYAYTLTYYSTVRDSIIVGTGNYIAGLAASHNGTYYCNVYNSTIKGIGSNSSNVGGLAGENWTCIEGSSVQNCIITSNGSNVGGITGVGSGALKSFVYNTKISGYSNVGGVNGTLKTNNGRIRNTYVNADITAVSNSVGGLVGYLNNQADTGVSNNNTTEIYDSAVYKTNIQSENNVGGVAGKSDKELYSAEFFDGIYVEANISGEKDSSSVGIGINKSYNSNLKNFLVYKYSKINGQNVLVSDEPFISENNYLVELQLKDESTYKNKLGWTAPWNIQVIENNIYPIINDSNFEIQEGVRIPVDSENIVENNGIQGYTVEDKESLEQTFEYNNKEIQTYSTYSVITASDGSQVTRNAKLYVKDNNLYAIPVVINVGQERNSEEIVSVANNLIIDSFNGKEYETVLGSDGKLYDLKEPIAYPENFVNSDIESIGNNLNSDVKEVEVVYKNGDKIKFNYQTGEVISSSEAKDVEKTGLFDYLKEKISEIGNSNSDVSQEIKTKYEASKELQTKLEETSVEEAIEKQNIANEEQGTEGITGIENNVTNNSLTKNKYISVYDEKIDDYLIYNEEELLDTTKEEVVSENEKIKANNLNEYYESEGETKNTKLGIVWIVIIIIGVGITLFVLGKKIGIRGRC